MSQSILAFLTYFATAAVLLGLFIAAYVHFTPYKEFELIFHNNNAAAIALSGAVLGFTFPLVSAIYFTHSLVEMAMWAAITCVAQMLVFLLLRRHAGEIEAGHTAPAIFLASLSIAVGLLNAVSIST